MKSRNVAIVILNYNGLKDTIQCLESLDRIDYRDHFTIVVDNASVDASSVVKEIGDRFQGVTVIRSEKNGGFAAGCNIGIRNAFERGADAVLLLNNDTFVAPDFLGILVGALDSDARIGIAGPKIYLADKPDRIWYDGAAFSWRDGGLHTLLGKMDRNPSESALKDTVFMTGCAFLIKKEVIEKIGMMPEEYFLYSEDIDWSLSARKAGYRIIVAPSAHVWHKVSRTTSRLGAPVRHYYHIRNALLLTARHASSPVRLSVYIWSFLHYGKQIIKYAVMPQRRAIALAIMRGISDFYRGKTGAYDENWR